MSHTHSCLLYHFVFSTRHREPWLGPDVRTTMFPYMAGILKELGAHPKIINGMPDHVHMFVGLKTTHCVADILREVKAGSSKFLRNLQTQRVRLARRIRRLYRESVPTEYRA